MIPAHRHTLQHPHLPEYKKNMNSHQDTLFLRTPRLDATDPDAMRATLRDYFLATFSRYELLFEVLSCDEAY
jgi:hypothetical protein